MIGGNQITFPKFKRPTSDRRLISDSPENESPVGFQIIILEKHLTALERQISAVHKILVKLVEFGVDVINAILVLSIDHEQNMRQSVRRVGVVNHGECVEVLLRANRGD